MGEGTRKTPVKIDAVNSSPVESQMHFLKANETCRVIIMLRYRTSSVATLVAAVVSKTHSACSLVFPRKSWRIPVPPPRLCPVSAGHSSKEIWICDDGSPLSEASSCKCPADEKHFGVDDQSTNDREY